MNNDYINNDENDIIEIEEESENQTVWNVFAVISYVIGIVSLSTCWCFGGFMGICGIIFGSLGKKGDKSVTHYEKAKKGLKNSIIALIISTVLLNIFIIAMIYFASTNK